MIKIEINDQEVTRGFGRLIAAGEHPRAAMQEIGELLVDSTKRRFVDQKDPDGNPWAPNRESTLLEHLDRTAGKGTVRKGEKFRNKYLNKDGRLSKRGAAILIAKKILVGESKRLGNEIHYAANDNSVSVGSVLEYSATQQFGAKKGSFGKTKRGRPIPWGDIPARPFLGLSDRDRTGIVAILNEHLLTAMQ